MEERRSNLGGTVLRLIVASCCVLVFGFVLPVFAYAATYGGGAYGGGVYNVGQATTSIALTSSLNPATVGASVTLTAAVTPSSATGSITFKDGGTTIGSATIGSGVGTIAVSSLTLGSHTLIAVYGGGTNYLSGTSATLTQVVNAASTSGGGGDTGGGGGGTGGHRGSGPSATGVTGGTAEGVTSPSPGVDTAGGLPQQNGFLEEHIDGNVVVLRDVPTNQWFAPYVHLLVESGIATGYKGADGKPTGLFGPANPVTEAEILKMALLAAGKEGTAGTPVNRSAQGDWSVAFVKTAEDLRLSIYTPALDVRLPATRGQVIQTILEAFATPITVGNNPFSDLRSSSRYAPAIETAFRLGIISGDTDPSGNLRGTVRPGDPINRAEVAKIVVLAMKVLKK